MTISLNTDTTVSQETIDRYREQIGVERPVTKQWHSEATVDTIKHWAYALGDDNPLYVDREYGKASRYGTNIAPPSFLYSTNMGPVHEKSGPSRGDGLPGLHAVWISDDWKWHRQVLVGTAISVSKALTSVENRVSRFGADVIDAITRYTFRQADTGDLIATQDVLFSHFGRSAAASQSKHADLKRTVWSDEDLAKFNADIDLEWRRGAAELDWDAVFVGESIPHVVKGPLTATEMITFVQGWGGPFMMASEITHKYLREHPKANVPDRHMRVPDFPERAHWDGDFARECGFPDGYDFGAQRVGWVTNGITNWMGDHAMLTELNVRLLALNIIGDATWCRGKIADKFIDDKGRKAIRLQLDAHNQRGTHTATGTAVVVTGGAL